MSSDNLSVTTYSIQFWFQLKDFTAAHTAVKSTVEIWRVMHVDTFGAGFACKRKDEERVLAALVAVGLRPVSRISPANSTPYWTF